MYSIQRLTQHNGFIVYQTQTVFDALELADILQKNNPADTIYVYDADHKKVN